MKIIPVRQAGVLNFLGRQKMVTVPIRWKSGEGDKHPETELAYITKPEKEKLIKLDMHGSMKDGKPNFGPAGLISLNSGGSGDGGGGGSGDGGSDGGGSSNDSGSSPSSGSDSTDTGDMGSEAANDASTNAGNASVGAGSTDSFGGYDPNAGFTTSPQDQVDTGDLGSEAANDAATASGAAAAGQGTFSPYGVVGFNTQRVANTLAANPGTALTLNAISLLTGIPGLSLAFAVASIFGTPSTNTSTSTSSANSGGGNTYNANQISQILTQVANQYTGPSAAKNFAQKYPSSSQSGTLSSQSGTLSFQSAYNTAKQNLGSLLTAPMSPYGNNAVSASPFYDYLKKNNLDRGIL